MTDTTLEEMRAMVQRMQALLEKAASEDAQGKRESARPVVRSPRPEVIAQVAARRRRRGQR